MKTVWGSIAIGLGILVAAAGAAGGEKSLDGIAREYVVQVLALGEHDPAYVDAYYGPEEWRSQAATSNRSVSEILDDARRLRAALAEVDVTGEEEMVVLRYHYLSKQLDALIAYAEILGGRKLSFDEESAALYDAVAPTHPLSYFQDTLDKLDKLLPGEGDLPKRLEAFYADFEIPRDKLDAVFTAAIEECRKRTKAHIDIPANERFEVEYVTDKSWSAYNWYKGNGYSVIQVNTDFPIRISRAIDLACHEGYPGHHLYNAMLEQHMAKERGWVEFTVYPLYSPQSLIAEGSANFGIEVAFPGEERIAFEKKVLFPLAGLDPEGAERYYQVEDIVNAMGYAGNEAARQFIDGDLSREQAVAWLVDNALTSRERAEQKVRFYESYRSYIINYNLGQDLVRDYIFRRMGEDKSNDRLWEEFRLLVSSPRLPSGLREP